MVYVLIGIIASIGLIIFLFYFGERDMEWQNTAASIVAIVLSVLTAIIIVCFCFSVGPWLGAEHKARIINKEYGTNYTQEEVFYASSVIDEIRNLDRKRIEVNGDLFKE